jgi:hypothetical protein
MSRYYAHINPTLTVDQVVVVSDEAVNNLPFPDSEPLGQGFLNALYANSDLWLETSITGEYRGKYAAIGDTYDAALNEFISPPAPEPDPEEGP